MRPWIVALVAVIALPTRLAAGPNTPKARQTYPLVVAFGNHTLSFPWHYQPLAYRFNPGVMVGTEYMYRQSAHLRLAQRGNLGFVQHRYVESAVFLETDLAISYHAGFGLYSGFLLGAGYMHTFSRRPLFVYREGDYTRVTDWGKPAVMLSVALEIGYDIKRDGGAAVSPFVQYRWFAQAPFSQAIPAMTHLLLSAGMKIYFGGNEP